MNTLRSLGAAIVAAALAGAMVACTTGGPSAESGGTLTVGMISDSSGNLNPFTATTGYPLDLVYDPLVRFRDIEGQPSEHVPVLATDWEFNDAFDELSMNLREDVVFSDGTSFNADVVVANFEESVKHVASYAALLGEATAEATGEYSVVIRWKLLLAPDRVLDYLGGGMVSGAALEDVDALTTTPVGSGPYLFDPEDSTTGSQLAFVPKDDHWNPDVYQWDRIVVKEFSDQVAILNALKSGQIDFGPIDLTTAGEAEAAGLTLARAQGTFTGLYFADRDGEVIPALGDVRVRQAINMALDREAIVAAVEQGLGTPSNQAWTEAWPEYHPELEDRYAYDPEGARELLAEAGYPDGFDLPMPSFGIAYEPAVEQALADIGIRVLYEPAPTTEFFTLANSGEYPVLLNAGPYGPIYIVNTGPFWVAKDGFYNVLAEPDPEIEELLTTISFGDEAESDEAASELGERILEEAWFAPISHPYALWAHIPELQVFPGYSRGLPPAVIDMRPAD